MNLKQIYDLAIELGIKNDLRGEEKVRKNLSQTKEKYEKLSDEKKKEFDMERLTNPYSDTRILHDNGAEVKKIMVGIDIEPAEILLAKELGVDTVISHHPEGSALADLGDVMNLQAEVLAIYGVHINIAQALTKKRIGEVDRSVSSSNHYRTVDTAKLMGINFACVHTPCDNLAADFLNKKMKEKNPEFVGEIVDILKAIPEYKEAMIRKAGPKLFAGSEESYAGKIYLTEITGGTSNSAELYEKMSQAGIGTIVGMHMGEKHKKEAEKYHINVVIAGHISSDSLGVNQFLDEVEKEGVEIVPCSGLIRIKR